MPCRWIVEFEVSDNWVADGFDLTDEDVKRMIETLLPHAAPDETQARIVQKPTAKEYEAAINRSDAELERAKER